jgi:hypothetical protein
LNSICAELSSLISVSLKRYGLLRPLNLVEVAVYVLLAHVVEGADDRPLEQGPSVLYAVRVDIAPDPFLFAET